LISFRPLNSYVFINTQRSGATHHFADNGYKRPKFLQSSHFAIEPGETIAITSSYGGPIQIEFSTNDLEVELEFNNIGLHAFWASAADNATFTEMLDAGDFDWAEIVTSGFEVHSQLNLMRKSIALPQWGTAEALARDTKQYTSNYPHVLAGFKGPGIDVVPEIHDFATNNNLSIHDIDIVKHMNADQATCGYGCSGNPYDAYWNFSPIGHGDIHELGHGLEKGRFRFEGWETHASTNPYSYYTKSQYNKNTGGEPDCQSLPFEDVYNKLQASVNTDSPLEYLKINLWQQSNWASQFMVTLQAMMHAQHMGQLENGWHLLARLQILEREINSIKSDWESKKGDIGFSTYSLNEFNQIANNDWLLISLSFAAALDYRDYLSMMGISYSQKAAAQVASFNYPMVNKRYFVSTAKGYCKQDEYGDYLDKQLLEVDGSSIYPEHN